MKNDNDVEIQISLHIRSLEVFSLFLLDTNAAFYIQPNQADSLTCRPKEAKITCRDVVCGDFWEVLLVTITGIKQSSPDDS